MSDSLVGPATDADNVTLDYKGVVSLQGEDADVGTNFF